MAQTPVESMALFRSAISRYFPKYDLELVLLLSVCVTLMIRGLSQPLCLLLLGPASVGKTTLLELIKGIQMHGDPLIVWRDNITPAAIVSGAPGIEPEEMLINQLNGHVLAVPELAPISSNQQSKQLYSDLIRLLDGTGGLVRATGNGTRGLDQSMRWAMLGAIVRLSDKMHKEMQNLGTRMVFLRLRPTELTFDQSVAELTKLPTKRSYLEKLEIGRQLVTGFFDSIQKFFPNGVRWDEKNDNPQIKSYIARIALLITTLSANIVKEVKSEPGVPQKPDPKRMMMICYSVSCGHGFLNGRTSLTMDAVSYTHLTLPTILLV